ncbi:MAG: hypothetical protein LBU45_02245 [Azoarcus sp.]|jgi:gp16 family phage-associated protein|nr:hypothetical protein [Azoarcus sp.]
MAAVDRNAVLNALYSRGLTLKSWCSRRGYDYQNASRVLRGVSRAYYGDGRRIADELNLIAKGAL